MAPACSIPLAVPFSELHKLVPLPDKREFPGLLQSIGSHIKNHRLSQGISIKEVIKQLNISRETLRGWEQNIFEPFVKQYPAIIDFLGYCPFLIDTMSLGGQIKEYRLKRGITQETFGELLSTDKSTVSQWETNKCVPLPQTQKKILELIGNQ